MEQYVYFGCFLFGLLFTVGSVFFGHHFGGHDGHFDLGTGGHAEAGYEHSGMPGISPFSPTTICSFLTAFGCCGSSAPCSTRPKAPVKGTSALWLDAPPRSSRPFRRRALARSLTCREAA